MKVTAKTLSVAALVGVAALVAAVAGAQQDNQMAPEQNAEMEKWAKFATPGPNHKLLEPYVGAWSVTTTFWQAPGAPPATSQGTAENAWVLGGRFIEGKFSGEMMGQPFQGIGYTGYDNFKKHFVGTWMDSMGTMVMVSTGHADPSGKVITMTGKMDDVVAGKTVTVREVNRVVDNDHTVFEMYGPDKSGKEFKMMEITYTRK